MKIEAQYRNFKFWLTLTKHPKHKLSQVVYNDMKSRMNKELWRQKIKRVLDQIGLGTKMVKWRKQWRKKRRQPKEQTKGLCNDYRGGVWKTRGGALHKIAAEIGGAQSKITQLKDGGLKFYWNVNKIKRNKWFSIQASW